MLSTSINYRNFGKPFEYGLDTIMSDLILSYVIVTFRKANSYGVCSNSNTSYEKVCIEFFSDVIMRTKPRFPDEQPSIRYQSSFVQDCKLKLRI